MESWSYISRGGNFVQTETVSAGIGGSRIENGMISWDLKSSNTFENGDFMSSSQEGVRDSQFVECYSAERGTNMLHNSSSSVPDVLSSQFGCRKLYSSIAELANTISGEEESSSKLTDSIVESNFRDTMLIDLKLGRFPGHKDIEAKANLSSPAAAPSMPVRRVRGGKLSSQTPYCQVHDCKKDLSNSKDYHKRHKVCDIHSKTAKVIVNGIEQRFCQQCSRFHLLSEFDDGKRSCRKRLAGHNERRRKPHVGMHHGRVGRFFHPYNGSEEWTVLDDSSTIQRLPSVSNSGCALSLLSSQAQKCPNITSAITTALPSITPTSHPNYSTTRITEKLKMVSPQASTSVVSSVFPISGANSADEIHMEPLLISDGIESDKYGITEFIPGSAEYMSTRNQLSGGDGSTINLLQLSSQLQRVEHQRQFMIVKQEDDAFFGLRIT